MGERLARPPVQLAQSGNVWQLRALVDAAGAGPVLGWGSPLSGLEQTCPYGARIAVPGPGLWRVRLQVRVVVAAHTVQCLGGQLFAEARKSNEY